MAEKILQNNRVFMADPNEIIATNKSFSNGTPPYQDMVPHVELYCIRKKGLTISLDGNQQQQFNTGNPIAYTPSQGFHLEGKNSVQKINFLNFDETTQSYTTKYTEDIVGRDNIQSMEGFGITSINIKLNSNYMPMVDITFVDVKGTALLNQGEKSPLAALFDYPPPIFKLRMKGVFGKYVEYDLHMTGNDVSFTDKGDYEIKARFIGEFFGPLTDVLLGYIKSVPYLKQEQSLLDSNSGTTTRLTSGDFSSVNSFFELINKGEILYAKVNEYKDNSSLVQQTGKLKSLQENIQTLLNEISKLRDTIPFPDSAKSTSGLDKIKKTLYLSQENTVAFSFVKDESASVPGLTTVFTDDTTLEFVIKQTVDDWLSTFQKKLDNLNQYNPPPNILASKYIKKGVDLVGDTTNPNAQNNNKYIYFLDLQELHAELKRKLNFAQVIGIDANKKVGKDLETIVATQIGFNPTIGNILELLLNDFDYFISRLRKAGENKKTSISSSYPGPIGKMIGDAPWPEVVSKAPVGGKGSNSTAEQEVLVYPGTIQDFRAWDEVLLVEEYCKSLVEQVREEIKTESFKSQVNGSAAIPLFPLEAGYISDTQFTNEYLGVDSLTNVYAKILKRYIATRDFAYPVLFDASDSDAYSETITQAFSYFYKGKFIPNQEKRVNLITSVAKAEATNLANALMGSKLAEQIAALGGISYETIKKELTANISLLNDEAQALFLRQDRRSPNLIFRDTNLNYRNTPQFQGIKDILDPATSGKQRLITARVGDGSDFDKQRTEFIKSIGDTIWGSTDELTPIVSQANTLIFKDHEANVNSNNGATDFTPDNPQAATELLTRSVISAFKSSNPSQTLLQTMGTADAFFGLINGYDDYDLQITILDNSSTAAAKIARKFLYPGAVEMPYWLILYMGYLCKNKPSVFGDSLSEKDQETFIKTYSDFAVQANYQQVVLRPILDRINADAISGSTDDKLADKLKDKLKTYSYYNQLLKPRYVVNDSSGTFLAPQRIEQKSFRSASLDAEDVTIKLFLSTFFTELKTQLDVGNKKTADATKDALSKISDNDFKANIYYSFKAIYDRWVAGKAEITDKTLFKRFKFITRSQQNIANICIVDFQNFLQDAKNPEVSVFSSISNFLGVNQFQFYPLHSFMDYEENSYDNWSKSFQIQNSLSDENISKPAFVCMYIGSYSSRLASGQESKSYQDDGFTLFDGETPNILAPIDFQDNNPLDNRIFAFRVRVGGQAQSIFSGFKMNTNEFKATDISLKTQDNIINKQTETSRLTKSQSLLNVYKQRSYSVGATIPLGNLCIQPTQYFQLEGVPIWMGTYIIYSVEHNMVPNRVTTSFKGYRLGKYVTPVVSDCIMSFLGISSTFNEAVNNNLDVLTDIRYLHEDDNITKLHIDAYATFVTFLQAVQKEGWKVTITDSRRTAEKQNELANNKGTNAKIPLATKGIFSSHIDGFAIDCNFAKGNTQLKLKDTSRKTWLQSGIPQIAVNNGLEWGGYYPGYEDFVHFTYRRDPINKSKGRLLSDEEKRQILARMTNDLATG